jgi:predicted nucleotidyltransferase
VWVSVLNPGLGLNTQAPRHIPLGKNPTGILMSMSQRLEFLRANSGTIKAIAARHKALSISVFGSVARGEDGPNSDFDFLVSFDEDSSLLDAASLMNELSDYLKTPVDVVSEGGLKPRDTRIRGEAVLL